MAVIIRLFSQEQYDLLMKCSKKKNMTEWNNWRKQNPEVDIVLAGAHLEDAWLRKAHLEGAKLPRAHLEGAELHHAHLEDADLIFAHLEGANLLAAHLEDAKFHAAFVDGSTLIWNCYIDSKTDFTGVGLDDARVNPGLKQSLKNNIRKNRWQGWCKESPPYIGWPVQIFFWMSDYGCSTKRILMWFFGLAFGFAYIYYLCGLLNEPGVIAELFTTVEGQVLSKKLVALRAVYFSIVTMTTLGFGDMYARSQSAGGHILLTIQVLLGYVLLGVLITRLAIVFTGEGPAVNPRFDMDKKSKEREAEERRKEERREKRR